MQTLTAETLTPTCSLMAALTSARTCSASLVNV